ncbi:MAG: hypothetical protein FWG51_03625, partial [Firmicutes bacterium]|nr:hypothetical protein [Bacillota bacterium]
MRKKIFALSIILLLVVSFLFGCGLIETNFEKDMQRTIAYVGDDDYMDEIKKYELVSYFYSSANEYIQNGHTVEETVDEFLKQMVYRRIVVQEVAKFLLNEFYNNLNSNLRASIIANGFTYYKIKGYSADGYDKSKIDTDNEWEIFDFEKVTVNIKDGMTLKDILDPQDYKVRVVGVDGIEPYDREIDAKSSDMLMFLLRVYYGSYAGISTQQFTDALEYVTQDFKTYYKALKNSSGFYDSNGYKTSAGFEERDGFSDYLAIQAYNSVWSSEKSVLHSIEHEIRKNLDVEDEEEDDETPKATRAIPKKDVLERTFVRPEP